MEGGEYLEGGWQIPGMCVGEYLEGGGADLERLLQPLLEVRHVLRAQLLLLRQTGDRKASTHHVVVR